MNKRYAQRDYAKLAFRWYRDDVLGAVADEFPHALAIWPVLVAMAKEESHDATNPTGEIRSTWKRLASACACSTDMVRAVVELMAEGEMLTLTSGKLGTVRITLVRFKKWQSPRGSEAERQQVLRDAEKAASRENIPERHPTVTGESRQSHPNVTSSSLDRDKDIDKTETKEEPSSTSAVPKRDAAAREVFEHWIRVWGKRSNTVFAGKRKTATMARLREGYTVEDLKRAVDGYRHSPHHMGANAEGKKWDDLELFMRSPTHVDAGISHGDAAATKQAAGTTALPIDQAKPRHAVSDEYDEGIQWHTNDPEGAQHDNAA